MNLPILGGGGGGFLSGLGGGGGGLGLSSGFGQGWGQGGMLAPEQTISEAPLGGILFENPREAALTNYMRGMGQQYQEYRPEMANARLNAMRAQSSTLQPYNNAMSMMYGQNFAQQPVISDPRSERMAQLGGPGGAAGAGGAQAGGLGGSGSGPMGITGGGLPGGGGPMEDAGFLAHILGPPSWLQARGSGGTAQPRQKRERRGP